MYESVIPTTTPNRPVDRSPGGLWLPEAGEAPQAPKPAKPVSGIPTLPLPPAPSADVNEWRAYTIAETEAVQQAWRYLASRPTPPRDDWYYREVARTYADLGA